MVILAPAPEQPRPAPIPVTPTPVVDRLDRKLVELIDQPDGEPVLVWPTIHTLVEAERPVDRAQRRRLVARLLCRLRGLLHAGSIERVDKAHVRLRQPGEPPAKPASKPVQNTPSVPYPTVGATTISQGGGPYRKVFNA